MRRRLAWLSTSLAVLTAGLAAFFLLSARVDDRITTGHPVPGVVTKVERLPINKFSRSERFVVSYTFNGARSATVNDAFADADFDLGERVTVFVDPAHPDRVALAGGYGSEGWLLLLAPFVVVLGIAGFLKVAVGHIGWWMKNERNAPRNVALLEIHSQTRQDLHFEWERELRRLSTAAQQTSAHRTGGLRLLLLLLVGNAGAPRVAWFSRRSQRLVVEVPVPADETGPETALRDAVTRGFDVAERWRAKHGRTTDANALAAAVAAVCIPSEEP